MERDALRKLLEQVRAKATTVNEAMERVRVSPLEELGFATLDLHRAVRRGFPEVVYGPGKSSEQIAEIVRRLRRASWEAEMALRKVRANPAIVIYGDDEANLEAGPTDASALRRTGKAAPYRQRDERDAP